MHIFYDLESDAYWVDTDISTTAFDTEDQAKEAIDTYYTYEEVLGHAKALQLAGLI